MPVLRFGSKNTFNYTYNILEIDIQALKARYPFLQVGVAGQSVLNKNLYYLVLGNGPNKVFYNGSHHAIEWITTPLLMKFTENFLMAYSRGESIRGYNLTEIWNRSTIYIMPMVNPDGVDLVLEGLSAAGQYADEIVAWNDTGLPVSQVWKANIRGVDLNLNYPARWEEAKRIKEALGVTGPAPTNYVGPSPFSEPETIAVGDFTREQNFNLVLAYHTQGRVIYWRFADYLPPNSLQIARLFSRASGYAVSEVPYESAYAGYKDWFIQEYNRPGYTIEAGLGKNPLPIQQFDTIYRNNEETLLLGGLFT